MDRDGKRRAATLLRSILAAIRRLVGMPRIGHRHPDVTNESLCAWPVAGYVVVYQPDTTPLFVVRVLHGSRDLRSLLDDGDAE